jgi:hypothetical protein
MSTETGKLKEQLFPTLERIVRRLVESFRALCKRADAFLMARYPVTLAQPPTKDELEPLLPQAQALFQ